MSDHDPERTTYPPGVVPDDDTEALRQAATNEAFSCFYRATIRSLVGFLLIQGASLPIAAEIAQEAMIKAYQRWNTVTHPKAWVYTVAGRALVRQVADIREDPCEQTPEPTSLLPAPDMAAEWEVRQDLLRILPSLPIRQRQVLAWTFAGYTPSEIAQQLRVTPDAVRASLKKARRAASRHPSAAGYHAEPPGEEKS
jgi:RNA polymerase sigma factor (sigma-70 family)